jgi:hypothetical protein
MKTEEKEAILSKVEGKREEETEKVLMGLFPEEKKRETLRQVNGEEARLSITLEADTLEALKQARDLLSHALPNATWAEVIDYLAHDFIQCKTAPVGKCVNKKGKAPTERMTEPTNKPEYTEHSDPGVGRGSAENANATSIPLRSCEYVDPQSGRRCGSTYQLEIDHIVPKALGGSDDPSNLRCLCKQHNLLEAERTLGRDCMQKYRRSG